MGGGRENRRRAVVRPNPTWLEGAGAGAGQSVHGPRIRLSSSPPSAPTFPAPPPGCAMHPEGRGVDGASNGVRCIGGHLLRLQKYCMHLTAYWHLELNGKYESGN